MSQVLPQHWQLARLGDVCQLNPRDPVPKDASGLVSFVPMSAIDEHSGEITAPEERDITEVMRGYTSFAEGDVLFAKITPCMENGKAAIARNLTSGRGFGSTEFHVLRPGPFVLAEWLFHFVRRDAFRRQAARNFTGTAGQQRVPTDFLQFTKIPVPPLSEQRRILEILTDAESIRALSGKAAELTAKLIPATFRKMFGDPFGSDQKWPTELLGKLGVLDRGRSRHRPRDEPSLYGGPYPFIQTGDITRAIGWVDSYTQTYSEAGLKQSRLWPAGTLCITIAANIAQTAIMSFEGCFPDSVVGFTPGELVTTEYVKWCLDDFQQMMEKRASTGAQKNINLETLRSLRIPIPPPAIQKQFTSVALQVRGLLDRAVLLRAEIRTRSSIIAHAFSGDMTHSWRTSRKHLLEEQAQVRDNALRAAGVKLLDTLNLEQTITSEIDRRRRDLSREQGNLLQSIQTSWKPDNPEAWVFTHETLAESLDGPLRGNADAIRRHLEVFAARGLIIPISREVELSDGTTEWRVAYRRPHAKTDNGPPEDAIRLQELANLAKQIKELQK